MCLYLVKSYTWTGLHPEWPEKCWVLMLLSPDWKPKLACGEEKE